MRIANVRVLCQAAFLILFVACLYLAAAPRLDGYPVSIFLEADPLVALSTAISTGQLYQIGATGLFLGIGLLVLTMIFGRFFCGWICPFGTLHHLVHWLGFSRNTKQRLEANRFRRWFWIKYAILCAMLVGAAFEVLQVGLLDPIPLLSRSMTDAVFPAVDAGLRTLGLPGIHPSAAPRFSGAWLIGLIFVTLLLLNLWVPRFFCRALCPLGALLGIAARFSLFRIHRDLSTCGGCNLCSKDCEGACEPEGKVRIAECMVCMNCVEDCPDGSLSYRFLPPAEGAVSGVSLPARRAVLASVGGLFLMTLLRRSGSTVAQSGQRQRIRPPGSLAEPEFLARCIKCDACLNVCPTGVLQPAGFENGFESLWTPILDMRMGYCDITCTLCGHVCPTGAIERLTPAQRSGLDARPDGTDGPVMIGTASYDRGRCLPWGMDTPCVVCEEVCPVSPKAIFTREETVVNRAGETVKLKRPYIDPDKCVGCGICEHECPIRGPAAVRVGAHIGTV
ncbi:MAG: 4Fe-4S dicluster domain-containing protein [Planctomycetota bacterium]|jgi:polyferredoxin